jgi:hypothetical protein
VQRTEIFVGKYCLVLFKVQRTVTLNIAVRCTFKTTLLLFFYKGFGALHLFKNFDAFALIHEKLPNKCQLFICSIICYPVFS